jgi:hypothetical protein
MAYLTQEVISVCSGSHLDVWARTSHLLPDFLSGDEFTVYVPDRDLARFEAVTDSRVRIESEEVIGSDFLEMLRRAVVAGGNVSRFGWYAQQFLKIEALRRTKSEQAVIWDADCVPVRPVTAFSRTGTPRYMKSKEHHPEYFSTISRLLNLQKTVDQSFIVPAFPYLKTWIEEFICEIEYRHGRPWFESVIMCTDFSVSSGFSEFETMGTWVAHRHPNEWESAEVRWERFGTSRFGPASSLSADEMVGLAKRHNLDVISFENWDSRGFRSRVRAFRRLVGKL